MSAIGGAATQAGNRGKPHDRNVILEEFDRLGAEAGEQQRGFDGMNVSRIAGRGCRAGETPGCHIGGIPGTKDRQARPCR